MNRSLLIFLMLFAGEVLAQDFSPNFGSVSQDEMKMNYCKQDPAAEAMVIYDVGESSFIKSDDGYGIQFIRTKRIKIFTESIIDEIAEVSIPYYDDGDGNPERVYSIKAYTYNLSGGKLEKSSVQQSAIFEERINDRWKAKKFVFPKVDEGSVIEFRYILETPYLFNLPDWSFQDKIPVKYSQYTVRMIPFYEYVYLLQGISIFDYQNSYIDSEKRTWGNIVMSYGQNIGDGVEFQDYVHTFAMKDLPAFKDESYITSINDYIIKMDFQLARVNRPDGISTDIITTWPELNKKLLKHENFGKYIKSCERLGRKIIGSELSLEGKSKGEKARWIIEYVKANFTYDEHTSIYSIRSAKDVFERKLGNSAEINLMLIALLNEAGINALPVIISTRNHGKIRPDYPFEHFFNYVLVYVEETEKYLADGTDGFTGYNEIPPRCINDRGLVVEKESVRWVPLYHVDMASDKYKIDLEPDPAELVCYQNVMIETSGYSSYYYKKTFRNDQALLKDYFEKKTDRIERVETENFEEPERSYILKIQGASDMELIGDHLILDPFLNLAIDENKFTQKERSYPVDFIFPREDHFSVEIHVPEGYHVSEVPDSFELENEMVRIKLQYEITETGIDFNGSYAFKKPIYSPEEYPMIKNYMQYIVQHFNEALVLTKNGSD